MPEAKQKEPIQHYVRGKPCKRCEKVEKKGTVLFCPKLGILINPELAERQTLCFFGDVPEQTTLPVEEKKD
jgi:hypothetical protein